VYKINQAHTPSSLKVIKKKTDPQKSHSMSFMTLLVFSVSQAGIHMRDANPDSLIQLLWVKDTDTSSFSFYFLPPL
jgi:hypothetical protein